MQTEHMYDDFEEQQKQIDFYQMQLKRICRMYNHPVPCYKSDLDMPRALPTAMVCERSPSPLALSPPERREHLERPEHQRSQGSDLQNEVQQFSVSTRSPPRHSAQQRDSQVSTVRRSKK